MRKNTLRSVAVVVVAGMLCLGGLTGCGKGKNTESYREDNEIYTFTPLETEKTVLTIRTEFNVRTSDIEAAIENQFPEIDAVVQLNSGQNTGYDLKKQLEHQVADDLIFSVNLSNQETELLANNLMDLSSESYVTNYQTSALNSHSRAGKLYYLPGPTDVQSIVYDKTLFDEHQWKVPASRDEFVALCHQIESETDLRAVQWTFKWPVATQTVTTGFSGDVFTTAGFQPWMEEYVAGKGSIGDEMTPALENIKYLIDENIIRAEDLKVTPTQRSNAFYKEHTAAMIMDTQNCTQVSRESGNTHEIAMLPFWNSNEPDSDYVVLREGYQIGVNKELEEKGNEEKLAAVRKILDYFSTIEGQTALAGEGGALSSVKDTHYAKDSVLSTIDSTLSKGNYVPVINFLPGGEGNAIQVALADGVAAMVKDKVSVSEAVSKIDAGRDTYVASFSVRDSEEKEGIAQASTDFTRLETGLYLADAFRRTADTDLALAYIGDASIGSFGRFYKGDITEDDITQLSCETNNNTNKAYGNQLLRIQLTGDEILSVLNAADLSNDVYSSLYCYYAVSGIHVEYAPYNAMGNKIVRVTHRDGSLFDLEKTYTVALWNGGIPEAIQKATGVKLQVRGPLQKLYLR